MLTTHRSRLRSKGDPACDEVPFAKTYAPEAVMRAKGSDVSLHVTSGRSTVVSARGEIDAANAGHLANTLSAAAEEAEGSLLIDLEDVGFLDGKGYAAILNADRKMRERGGEAVVVCDRSTIRRIFTLLDRRGRLRLFP